MQFAVEYGLMETTRKNEFSVKLFAKLPYHYQLWSQVKGLSLSLAQVFENIVPSIEGMY